MSKYVLDSEWKTKYKNFSKSEFKCKCGKCDGYGKGIASSLLDALQYLRDKYGVPINTTSGYRCKAHNKRVGGSATSKHLTGQACDFYFGDGSFKSETKRKQIMNELKKINNYRYTYCNIDGSHPNMGYCIHVDFHFKEENSKCKLTTGVWSRVGGYGFKYKKYKVIPKGTILEVLKRNIGSSNGYNWDKVKWNGKVLYLPNKWSTYL